MYIQEGPEGEDYRNRGIDALFDEITEDVFHNKEHSHAGGIVYSWVKDFIDENSGKTITKPETNIKIKFSKSELLKCFEYALDVYKDEID